MQEKRNYNTNHNKKRGDYKQDYKNNNSIITKNNVLRFVKLAPDFFVPTNQILYISKLQGARTRKMITKYKREGSELLIDATNGKAAVSIVGLLNGVVILTNSRPEKLLERINESK